MLLQPRCSPTLVPLLPTSLTKLAAPLAKDGVLEANEVAVALVVGVGEPPRELTTDDAGLVNVGTDDGHGEVGGFVFLKAIVGHPGATNRTARKPLSLLRSGRRGGTVAPLDRELGVFGRFAIAVARVDGVGLFDLLLDPAGIGAAAVVVVQTERLERIEMSHLQTVPDGLLQHVHMLSRDGVCFGDDGDDGGLALKRAEDLEVEILV